MNDLIARLAAAGAAMTRMVGMKPCEFCGRMPAKRPRKVPGALRDRVLAMFDANPLLTSYQIADAVDSEPSHVRTVLKRHGRKLARARGSHGLGDTPHAASHGKLRARQ